jgi:hypothetical protein
MREYSIRAEITTGNHCEKGIVLPQINLSPSKEEILFQISRRQYPIR